MAAHDDPLTNHPVVSHEEWLRARRALLEKEKACTKQCDEMSALQRSLPWERVTNGGRVPRALRQIGGIPEAAAAPALTPYFASGVGVAGAAAADLSEFHASRT